MSYDAEQTTPVDLYSESFVFVKAFASLTEAADYILEQEQK